MINPATGADERPADDHVAPPFASWLQEVRSDSAAPPTVPVPVPTPLTSPASRPARRDVWLAGTILLLATLAFAWAQSIARNPTGAVIGTLRDPKQRPVAGARVFVASRPDLKTTTDRTGDFLLLHIPTGEKSLIAVLEDRGEEYPVHVEQDTTTFLGTVIYRVPPLRFRIVHGDGVEWDGER